MAHKYVLKTDVEDQVYASIHAARRIADNAFPGEHEQPMRDIAFSRVLDLLLLGREVFDVSK